MELSKITKYEELEYHQWVAFGNRAGGVENVVGVLQGDMEIEILPANKKRFDHTGRRIPPRGLEAAVCDPDRDFHLVQPPLGYAARLQRLTDIDLTPSITAADFQARVEDILTRVKEDETIANLLNAVHLPLVIPQTVVTDLGQTTEKFVTAAGQSYQRQFPDRSFTNYREGELAGQVSVVEGSGYDKLLAAIALEPVVALYFPNPLQGFSVEAQREQMSSLPGDFVLSGPLDTAIGWMMYPDVVGRGFKTPVNDCSAVNWQSPQYSLYFNANDDNAKFDNRDNLANANDNYSGGLLLLGLCLESESSRAAGAFLRTRP